MRSADTRSMMYLPAGMASAPMWSSWESSKTAGQTLESAGCTTVAPLGAEAPTRLTEKDCCGLVRLNEEVEAPTVPPPESLPSKSCRNWLNRSLATEHVSDDLVAIVTE